MFMVLVLIIGCYCKSKNIGNRRRLAQQIPTIYNPNRHQNQLQIQVVEYPPPVRPSAPQFKDTPEGNNDELPPSYESIFPNNRNRY